MPVLIEVDDEGAFELGLGENHVCLPLEPYLIKLLSGVLVGEPVPTSPEHALVRHRRAVAGRLALMRLRPSDV